MTNLIPSTLLALALATPAAATTWTYDLGNFVGPNGVTEDLGHRWGLAMWPRHETKALLFDFGTGNVQLSYDDAAGTARIWGDMTEVFSGSGAYVEYSMDSLTNVGPGQFVDTVGNGIGTLSWGDQIRSIYAEGMDGFFFALTCDHHRLPVAMQTPENACGGHGWITMNGYHGAGVKDFIFTAHPSQVPLPAGVVLLLSALAGLGAYRKHEMDTGK